MRTTVKHFAVDAWFEPVLGPLSWGGSGPAHPIWRFNGYVCLFGACLQLTVYRKF